MEFIAHGDLFKLLHNKERNLDWALRVKIAVDIASGMLYLHSANPPIIHRDLKSVNVMINSTNPLSNVVAKITDFGLSGAVQTVSNHEVANPRWLAPEIMKKEEFTLASDVYSYGIILWELVARKLPFEEIGFDNKVEEAVMQGKRPTIPSDSNSTFAQLISDCWMQNPDKRPTFKEIRTVLTSIVENVQKDLGVKFNLHPSTENLFDSAKAHQSSSNSLSPSPSGELSQEETESHTISEEEKEDEEGSEIVSTIENSTE